MLPRDVKLTRDVKLPRDVKNVKRGTVGQFSSPVTDTVF